MQTTILRIGTRGSPLALAQASEVRARLMLAHDLPEDAFTIEIITTSGDRIQDRPLSEAGGKGLFTKEIEEALLGGRIDIAVHSSKDMPTVLPNGLALTTFLPREDARDAFVGREAKRLKDMPHGATIGSSSLRRQALIRRMRPDLSVILFRGNVDTRLRKLDEGQAGGTLLAYAGLKRLRREEVVTELLPLDEFPPAPGQGAIGIEQRVDDERVGMYLRTINDLPTATALAAERAFLAVLDGSCRTPIAGHATVEGERVSLHGMVLTPDGRDAHEVRVGGDAVDAAGIGRDAGEKLRAAAGPRFFETWT